MKLKTLTFVAVMFMPVTAHAVSVNFGNADLFGSAVNAALDSATLTVDGLTLNATASNGGVVDVYSGGGPNGLVIGAPSNGDANTDFSGLTNPASGDYSLIFDKAVTSIEVTFGFLSNIASPPETISTFSADATALSATDIIVSNLVGTSYTAAGVIIANLGVGNGTGIFTYSGAAFNSFSFFHEQNPTNIGFVISNLKVELAPVPVPAALPLLAGGLGLMGLLGWRRKRKTAAAMI